MIKLLEVKDLTGGYGRIPVVFDVSLEVKRGGLLAIVGPNGSGKSTLVKLVVGLAMIHKGEIRFRGEDITRVPTHRRISLGIGYVPQTRNIFPGLTVEENLEVGAYTVRGREFEERAEKVYELFPVLEERRRQKAETLSGGERRMLAIARVLIADPDLIILDEPSAGLAPKVASEIFRNIKSINEMGKTIILVEQHARKALSICDDAIVMVSGRIVLRGKGEELLRMDDLRLAFLGKGS